LAKFGLLYLHKGSGMANNCLTSWAKYVATPTNTSNGVYGTFWLNAGGKFPDAPKDLYSASGYQGQKCLLFLQNTFIVRLGLTDESQFDINEVLKILGSFKK
jgi:hypothetical protein